MQDFIMQLYVTLNNSWSLVFYFSFINNNTAKTIKNINKYIVLGNFFFFILLIKICMYYTKHAKYITQQQKKNNYYYIMNRELFSYIFLVKIVVICVKYMLIH